MALILNDGSVFLHIPKTGGNWVTKVLLESNLVRHNLTPKHADCDRLSLPSYGYRMQAVKFLFSQLFSIGKTTKPFMFCFVRNPLSWYESWFKYMSQPSRNWLFWGDRSNYRVWHPNAVLDGLGSKDFNQFLRNVIAKRPGYVTEMFGWYTQPEVDFIGKQETLREDLIRALKLTQLSFDEQFIRDFPAVGVSQLPDNTLQWDETIRATVYRLEYSGIVRYGYDQGDYL